MVVILNDLCDLLDILYFLFAIVGGAIKISKCPLSDPHERVVLKVVYWTLAITVNNSSSLFYQVAKCAHVACNWQHCRLTKGLKWHVLAGPAMLNLTHFIKSTTINCIQRTQKCSKYFWGITFETWMCHCHHKVPVYVQGTCSSFQLFRSPLNNVKKIFSWIICEQIIHRTHVVLTTL